jgi:hypothetical protein
MDASKPPMNKLLLAALLIGAGHASAGAQTASRGGIQGTARAPQGRAFPTATVTVAQLRTNETYSVRSAADGTSVVFLYPLDMRKTSARLCPNPAPFLRRR